MKTAISLPDELFGQADLMAAQLQVSRSELYSRALQEFLARHAPDRVTEALDALFEAFDAPQDVQGYLASVSDPAGQTYSMTYSTEPGTGGLLTRFTDPRENAKPADETETIGKVNLLAYDDQGRIQNDIDTVGGGWSIAKESVGFYPYSWRQLRAICL